MAYNGAYTGAEIDGAIENVHRVDNLSGLRALTATATRQVAYMQCRTTNGDGGHGEFRWDASDLSAEVTADTQSGIYVAPDSDATGASGAWVRQTVGAIDPAWFGSGSAAVQAAVGFGGVVDLGGRVYYLSDTVVLVSGVTVKNGTLAQNADNISLLYGDGLSDITIEELILHGKEDVSGHTSGIGVGRTEPNQGIKLVGVCSNVKIRKNSITRFVNHGVYIYGSDDCIIEDNHIYDIGQREIGVNTPVDSTSFAANFSGGLSCLYIDGDTTNVNTSLVVRRNEIHGCLNTAISLVYAKGIADISENEIYDSDSNGFQCGTGCEKIKAHSNKIHSLTGYYNPAVEGYALSIHQDGHNSEILHNMIWDCKRGAINTKASNFISVFGNHINNGNENGSFGAIVAYGSDCLIQNNHILNCEYNGVHVSTINSYISENIISFSSTTQHSGIVVNTTYNASAGNNSVTGNKAITNGILLSLSAPNTRADRNKNFAIYTSGTSIIMWFRDNDIVEYRASGGGDYGLRLTGSVSAVVSGGTNTATNKYQNQGTGGLYLEATTYDYRKTIYGSAAPLSGAWLRGDRIINQDPSAGGTEGWVCTTGGTPGVWKTFGVISA